MRNFIFIRSFIIAILLSSGIDTGWSNNYNHNYNDKLNNNDYNNEQEKTNEGNNSFAIDLDNDNMEIEFDLDFEAIQNAPLVDFDDENENDNSKETYENLQMAINQNKEPTETLEEKETSKNTPENESEDTSDEIVVSQLMEEKLASPEGQLDEDKNTNLSLDGIKEDVNQNQKDINEKEETKEEQITTQTKEEPKDYLSIRVLNKISGKTKQLYVPLNQTTKIDNLEVTVKKIKRSDEFSAPEVTAFIEVKEHNPRKGEEKIVFSGWMFMSDPAISAMEHPVYDIWIADNSKKPDTEPSKSKDT